MNLRRNRATLGDPVVANWGSRHSGREDDDEEVDDVDDVDDVEDMNVGGQEATP